MPRRTFITKLDAYGIARPQKSRAGRCPRPSRRTSSQPTSATIAPSRISARQRPHQRRTERSLAPVFRSPELLHRARIEDANGRVRNAELEGRLLVRPAARHQVEDLLLARGERARGPAGPSRGASRGGPGPCRGPRWSCAGSFSNGHARPDPRGFPDFQARGRGTRADLRRQPTCADCASPTPAIGASAAWRRLAFALLLRRAHDDRLGAAAPRILPRRCARAPRAF